MAKSYPINPNFGIILTDSGNIIAMTDDGPIDPSDSEKLLQLALAAAVEVNYLEGELHRVAGSISDALAEFARPILPKPRATEPRDSGD